MAGKTLVCGVVLIPVYTHNSDQRLFIVGCLAGMQAGQL